MTRWSSAPNKLIQAREAYHTRLRDELFRPDETVIFGNTREVLTRSIFRHMGIDSYGCTLRRRVDRHFQLATAEFLQVAFRLLRHVRPGDWIVRRMHKKALCYKVTKQRKNDAKLLMEIAQFTQYSHLAAIARAITENSELAESLGRDFIIKPDIVMYRQPVYDSDINEDCLLVDDRVARLTSLRKSNDGLPLLHASISCRFFLRGHQSQNAHLETLNLFRNRRGNLPHVVIVTAEPYASRLASAAFANGDIDCIYHFALGELERATVETGDDDAVEALNILIKGKRLKDISDLPLDLAV